MKNTLFLLLALAITAPTGFAGDKSKCTCDEKCAQSCAKKEGAKTCACKACECAKTGKCKHDKCKHHDHEKADSKAATKAAETVAPAAPTTEQK